MTFAKSPSSSIAVSQLKRHFFYDLDGDHQNEEILLTRSGENELGAFFYLEVLDQTGKRIWAGPKDLDSQNPLVFGTWHFGISLPEVIGDIDGDGAIELIAPAPQSDISPTAFRVLRWENRRFKPVRVSTLLEKPEGSGRFQWKTGRESLGTWVSRFLRMGSAGEVTVEITAYQGGMDVKKRQATLQATLNGFELKHAINNSNGATPDLKQPVSLQNNTHQKNDAYQQYIAAYKQFASLLDANKGDTQEGREAYVAYRKAKKRYKRLLITTTEANKKVNSNNTITNKSITKTVKSSSTSVHRDKRASVLATSRKDKSPIFLSDDMYEFYNTPVQVIYYYTADSLFSLGRVSHVGSPKISKKRVSITFVMDGKKQSLVFIELKRKGDKAEVSVGAPKAKKKTLYRLRKLNGRWAII